MKEEIQCLEIFYCGTRKVICYILLGKFIKMKLAREGYELFVFIRFIRNYLKRTNIWRYHLVALREDVPYLASKIIFALDRRALMKKTSTYVNHVIPPKREVLKKLRYVRQKNNELIWIPWCV